MASLSRFLLLALLLLTALAVATAEASTQSYYLQRRMGLDGEWQAIASFALSRQTTSSPVRFKASPSASIDLTKEQKDALATAPLVYYRAFPYSEGEQEVDKAVVIAVSACSIIRGFDAVDSKTVVMRERIRAVPGPGTTLLGLQFSSETNFFHSKMLNGDECDHTVVSALFPVVRVQADAELAKPVAVANKVRYEDLQVMTEEGDPKAKKRSKPAPRTPREGGEAGEEEEAPVDERSFLQKYWMYLVLPVVISFFQNMNKK